MPVYEYFCKSCDESFTHTNSVMNYKKPSACPDCGGLSERAIYSAPTFNSMRAETRKAYQINEKSAHEPRVSHGHGHTCGSGCNHSHSTKPAEPPKLKQQNKQRPWMLGH